MARKTYNCVDCSKSFVYDDSFFSGDAGPRSAGLFSFGGICGECEQKREDRKRQELRDADEERRHRERENAEERRHQQRLNYQSDQSGDRIPNLISSHIGDWSYFHPMVLEADSLIEQAIHNSRRDDPAIMELFLQAGKLLQRVIQGANFNMATYQVIVKLAKHSKIESYRELALMGLWPILKIPNNYPQHRQEAKRLLRELNVSDQEFAAAKQKLAEYKWDQFWFNFNWPDTIFFGGIALVMLILLAKCNG